MNKSAIQKYAIWARKELIEQVKQRAFQYGISETGFGDENASIVAARVLSNDEKRQRKQFIEVIKRSTYQQTIEEVAYTWFNRFIALRYMEVNDYLPTHVRVFSDTSGSFKPEILSSVLHIELPGLDKSKVSEYINSNQTQELYRYILLTQCNALNELLPEMFERLGAYTEMLLPNNILKSEGVIGRLVNDIPEEDFKDAIQIIGWMYQYYNTEPKQEVFDGLKKNIKITKEKIPAATQLFTPDWIVRYMVENSLGRLWLDSHPNSKLREGWKYYIDEAEQTPEVGERLRVLRTEHAIKSPEEIKFIDPCMGSGHILVYAFDVLMQIYTSEGYSERDTAQLILEKNLFGLDIDRRAYQLSYFALMMKARQYNRRILSLGVHPQVYEPTGYPEGVEFGSLSKVEELEQKPEKTKDYQSNLFDEDYETKLNTWNFRNLLAQKYDVVVTNPPYMSANGMGAKLSEFVKINYPDSKSDLFAVFIEKCSEILKTTGYQAMITQHVWMFLTSFEKLREKMNSQNIINMAHLGTKAFEEISGEVVQTSTFVLAKQKIKDFKAIYVRLVNYNSQQAKEEAFLSGIDRYVAKEEDFQKIPGCPTAYWIGKKMLKTFDVGIPLHKIGTPSQGMSTCDVNRFVKYWYEVVLSDTNITDHKNHSKWIRYNKGGEFRKWYGNRDSVVFWGNDGSELLSNKATLRNRHKYFSEFIAWTKISGSGTGFRDFENEFLFDGAGGSFFLLNNDIKYYILGFLNTKIASEMLNIISPTLNYNESHIGALPYIKTENINSINSIVANNISLSRNDWDAFETSWDFKRHPLI